MDDIDSLLGRLRELPLDPRLPGIDAAVFNGIADAQRPMLSSKGLALVALLSMSTGLAGTLVPAHASTPVPISSLVAPGPLAPSTLLGAANE